MSVQKRTTRRADGTVQVSWRVRWMDADRWRSRSFDLKRDAQLMDAELRRLRRLGALATLDAGAETLDDYVVKTWTPTFGPSLSPKTRALYGTLYDHHIAPELGSVALRDLTAELVNRWQADRAAAGAGPSSVRKALALLASIVQRACESGRLQVNVVRLVRPLPQPRRAEVRPLAPATIEAMRSASSARDAVLISVLAYSGLRPGEALALRWGDVRERTLLVERALSLGETVDTKTRAHRAVRLLAPLASDLREWRMRSGRPRDSQLIFPGHDGGSWSEPAWQSWRRRAFARALKAAGVEHARPYDLRHSFASLLLHEGRSVIYVARQLGHDARLTLTRYGHVIDEFEGAPGMDAEEAITAARSSWTAHELPITAD